MSAATQASKAPAFREPSTAQAGVGSARGMYFLELLIFANIPAFLWLGYYGLRIAWLAGKQVGDEQETAA